MGREFRAGLKALRCPVAVHNPYSVPIGRGPAFALDAICANLGLAEPIISTRIEEWLPADAPGRETYRANVCVVSSLRDGMNLVAKEFFAARKMPGALLVNPYATDAFADALNIVRWAGLHVNETFRLDDAELSA